MRERILKLRKQLGLSQEQLGEQLGVSRQAVSKWESGAATPDVDNIIAMCELFNVTADYLLRGIQTEEKPVSRPLRKCGCILLIIAAILLPILLFGPKAMQWMDKQMYDSWYTDASVYLGEMPMLAVKWIEIVLISGGIGCLVRDRTQK